MHEITEKEKAALEKGHQLNKAIVAIFRNPTTTADIVASIKALVKIKELERDFGV